MPHLTTIMCCDLSDFNQELEEEGWKGRW
jgi:hypothetical protein